LSTGAVFRVRLAPMLVLLATTLGLWVAVVDADRKPLWLDELSTLLVASQPSVASYIRVQPVDAQPPLDALLVHAALLLPLPLEISTRLPSMLGYVVAGWAIYLFVSRGGLRLGAAVAATSFLLGVAVQYAIEARPYALEMGLVGLVLVCWQGSIRSRNARPWLVALVVAMAMLTLTQAFGFLFGAIPIASGEFVRWRERRRFDWKIALSVAAGLLPIGFVVWLSARTKLLFLSRFHGETTGAAVPDLNSLAVTLFVVVGSHSFQILVMAAICLVLLQDRPATPSGPPKFEASEWAAVSGVLLAALMCWGLAVVYTHYYFPRYGCATLVAISILVGMGLSLWSGSLRNAILWSSEAALVIAFAISAVLEARMPYRSAAANSRAEALWSVPPDGLPIVVASALDYQQVERYAPVSLQPRLIFVTDQARALRTSDFVPELVVDAYSDLGVLGSPVTNYDQFLQKHRAFYVLSPGLPSEWLPDALVREGMRRTKVKHTDSRVALYQR